MAKRKGGKLTQTGCCGLWGSMFGMAAALKGGVVLFGALTYSGQNKALLSVPVVGGGCLCWCFVHAAEWTKHCCKGGSGVGEQSMAWRLIRRRTLEQTALPSSLLPDTA